jgi:hypothetical protein
VCDYYCRDAFFSNSIRLHAANEKKKAKKLGSLSSPHSSVQLAKDATALDH